eukprot:m.80032 g.80032  ORF g.80032 m.80032 type:complete len:256 (-) comp9318_c0_seq2:417-1184(-)
MTDVMMLSLAPSACVLDNPLPSGPYRQQSKTRKRFSRNTPEAVKERLRRRRNREAAQDLRNRKKRYEMALQSKLDELNSDVDNLTAEERMLLEEQKQLQRQLQATLTGRPLMAPSVAEDVDSDSKAWAMARPRVTVGGLDSPVSEPETTMMVGPSIEPAVSIRSNSQQTNSHHLFGLLMVPAVMCSTMSPPPETTSPTLTTSALKPEPELEWRSETGAWSPPWSEADEGSDRPRSISPILSFDDLPTPLMSSGIG